MGRKVAVVLGVVTVGLVTLAGCSVPTRPEGATAQGASMGTCLEAESEFARRGVSFCYPADLTPREREADTLHVSLQDLSDPRNFFGYKITVTARPLGPGEGFGDAFAAAVAAARHGAAKRDHRVGEAVPATLGPWPGRRVSLSYTLDARHVEYTAPDGTTHEAGGDPVDVHVTLTAAEHDGQLLMATLHADAAREAQLLSGYERVVATLRATGGAR